MLTLWDFLPKKRAKRSPGTTGPAVVVPRRAPAALARSRAKAMSPSAQRYERLTRECLAEYGIRVRKWRTSMTGVAWEVRYQTGGVSRLIEAPRPKGPMSAAVFLHEIGHHAIGFTRYKPRCLEEYHAWMWSLAAMERYGVTITESVKRRVHESLHYAVLKAARRGLRHLPEELVPYAKPPAVREARTRRPPATSRASRQAPARSRGATPDSGGGHRARWS